MASAETMARAMKLWALKRQGYRCECGEPVTEADHAETWPHEYVLCPSCVGDLLGNELGALERDRAIRDEPLDS